MTPMNAVAQISAFNLMKCLSERFSIQVAQITYETPDHQHENAPIINSQFYSRVTRQREESNSISLRLVDYNYRSRNHTN